MELVVDTSKWKSVLMPVELYLELKAIAHAEGRTLSGQFRIIFKEWREAKSVPTILDLYEDQ